jgi:TolA-binding protein
MAHVTKALVTVALLLLCAPLVSGQAAESFTPSTVAVDMKNALDAYRTGDYAAAAPLFEKVAAEPGTGDMQRDALLLGAKSRMATGGLADARRDLDLYIAKYRDSVDYPEAVYQKARLLFLQDNLDGALQALQAFIDTFPSSPFVSSAWYWAAESLYGLGRLDDAQTLYEKIVSDYPTSVKVEAARYRIDLIRVQRKEVELSRLVTWSHEELLRMTEDFKVRERAYLQELDSYQKRLAGSGAAAADDLKTIADLRQQLALKTDEAARLKAQVDAAAASAAAQSPDEAARLEQTLAAKEAALALKEQYLGIIELESGAGK